MRIRMLLTLLLAGVALGMAGCGSSETASQRRAVSKLTLPADFARTVGGIQLTLNIPPGVSVATDAAGSVAAGAVELVGASASASLQKSYKPATAAAAGSLTLIAIEPDGFAASEYLMIHLDITGEVPAATDFFINNMVISDLNGRTIPITNFDYSVEII
jgi:hypothetical protein